MKFHGGPRKRPPRSELSQGVLVMELIRIIYFMKKHGAKHSPSSLGVDSPLRVLVKTLFFLGPILGMFFKVFKTQMITNHEKQQKII